MSITEVKARDGWYDVVVYDRVSATGHKPVKVSRRVQGLRKARKVERELENARERGSLVARSQTLAAYAERYLASRRAEVSAQTHSGYAQIVDRYIGSYPIADMKVSDVDVTAVSTFYADLLLSGCTDKPLRPESVRGVHRVLSMILKRATIDGLLLTNPCQVAKPPKDPSVGEAHAEPGMDPEKATKFLRAVAGTPVYTIAAVALGTGLRRSELLGLTWDDVDLPAGELQVRGKLEQVGPEVTWTAPKTKRSARSVPFGKNVVGALKQQKREIAAARLRSEEDDPWVNEGWVFPCLHVSMDHSRALLPAGRCWTPSGFAQEWRRVTRGKGWPGVGIHALRHTYATAQLVQGVRDEVVSRRMGHSSSLVTRRVYSHVTQAEQREGVDAADGLIGS